MEHFSDNKVGPEPNDEAYEEEPQRDKIWSANIA